MKKTLYIIATVILVIIVIGVTNFNFINNNSNYLNKTIGQVNDLDKISKFKDNNSSNKSISKIEINNDDNKEINKLWIKELEEEYEVNIKRINNSFVISELVDFPKDCLGSEVFNDEENTCEIYCNNKTDCLMKESEIDEILAKEYAEWENFQEEFSKDFTELELDSDEIGDSLKVSYNIEPMEKFIVTKGNEDEKSKKIKNWLAIISPDNFSNQFLKNLIIYSDPNTDGLAYVEKNKNQPDMWSMYVNIGALEQEGDNKETVFTLVHEFAHILTLNKNQMDSAFLDDEYAECEAYLIPEGCLDKNAYLNKFYKKFWEEKFDPMAKSEFDNYDKNPDAFVDTYAATNPGEDIAETFASFVFKKKPTGTETIAEQKIMFFYNYPELIKIRSDIRDQLTKIIRNRIKK